MNRRITVIENILSANDRIADLNRNMLNKAKVFSLNIMASPGAGKTTFIEKTIEHFLGRFRLAVINGDIATTIDADRASVAGAIAVQVNTGGECHLDAQMISNALQKINLEEIDLLIVENVGNLVCPASFKLGTHKNILIASVPEGDDKPYKYPGMYQGADALIVNKIDLLPYIPFKMEYFIQGIKALNPKIQPFFVSCLTKEGLNDWFSWITDQIIAFKSLSITQD